MSHIRDDSCESWFRFCRDWRRLYSDEPLDELESDEPKSDEPPSLDPQESDAPPPPKSLSPGLDQSGSAWVDDDKSADHDASTYALEPCARLASQSAGRAN